jgi:D-ribulokinase
MKSETSVRLGIDFGTSGARAIAISEQGQRLCEARVEYLTQNPEAWRSALVQLFEQLPQEICQNLVGIAIDGTSSTVMLCDRFGNPLGEALMYNDDRAAIMVDQVRQIAPPNHTVISATSSLAKLLWFSQQPGFDQAHVLLHQADWLAFLLHGQLGISDYHNALKLGYDVEKLAYPDWLEQHELRSFLPEVRTPGSVIGPVLPEWCERFGISTSCQIHAGTTDSIAAFLASGADQIGDAVTSLGSTLVIKLLSAVRLEDSRYGIYSHRLSHLQGDRWLVGGASNTGGAVLRSFFTDEELCELTPLLDPSQPTGLHYYPLTKPGDRFPINDPHLEPCLSPRSENSVVFLQGMLEGMARIESEAYALLNALGASTVRQIYTAGGGAKNEKWSVIREQAIGKPIVQAIETEAAIGVARLMSLNFLG